MADDDELLVGNVLRIPIREFTLTHARSSGPGGQNVNKVNSKVYLHWPVSLSQSLPEPIRVRFLRLQSRRIRDDGVFVISSERYRDQLRNRMDCLDKLRALLIAAMEVPKPRKATRPSAGSKLRRLDNKKRRAQVKEARRRPRDE